MNTEQARMKILEKKQYAAHHMEAARDAGLASRVRDMEETIAAYALADEALEEKQEREHPQPLSLDALRERSGWPVWIVEWDTLKQCHAGHWELSADADDYISEREECFYDLSLIGSGLQPKGWLAYDYKPKEAC